MAEEVLAKEVVISGHAVKTEQVTPRENLERFDLLEHKRTNTEFARNLAAMPLQDEGDDLNLSVASIKSRGRSPSARKDSEAGSVLPPMSYSIDFGRSSLGKSSKKSREGS